jgi:hypothetical protein
VRSWLGGWGGEWSEEERRFGFFGSVMKDLKILIFLFFLKKRGFIQIK